MPSLARHAGHIAYGLYAWSVFAVIALFSTLLTAAVPGLERRRRIARGAARGVFRCCGVSLAVTDLDRLPAGPCVVVANHASYLDGVILTAVLPPRFSFVVKREMTTVPLAHLLLRRLGTHFVERFERGRSAVDARRMVRIAGAGQGLAVFPEGTFRAEPGLGRFHAGAFAAAVRARIPVVPVTLHGSRDILPAERWLPRPGRLDVYVHAPLEIDGAGRTEVIRVREATRAAILSRLEEPDLRYAPAVSATAEAG